VSTSWDKHPSYVVGHEGEGTVINRKSLNSDYLEKTGLGGGGGIGGFVGGGSRVGGVPSGGGMKKDRGGKRVA